MSQTRVTNIKKRRNLRALYEKGKLVRFGPDGVVEPGKESEDDVAIWVQPPNPLNREEAIREGSAAKARVVLSVNREDDGEGASIRSFVTQMDDGTLLSYLLEQTESDRHVRATREVQSQEEWDDLVALQDSLRQWEEDGSPSAGEEGYSKWEAVLDRDLEYGRQIKARMRELREAESEAMQIMSRPERERRAISKRAEATGSAAFMKQYERAMVYFACRDDEDHSVLFFESINEMMSMPEEIYEALRTTVGEFLSEESEVKNSSGAADGSELSALPAEPGDSELSTPETATA